MNSNTRRRFLGFLAGGGSLALTGRSDAQAWPIRSVRMVVPYAAGGAIDTVARIIAGAFQAQSGQPFVVDNRAGASGMIGLESVARARPDGYTLLVAPDNNFTVNPLIYPGNGVDPNVDLTPVALLVRLLLVLAVHESVPARTLPEFIAYAKSRPRAVSCATAGEGTPHHLALRALERAAGIELLHVPYKGGAPAVADAAGGHVDAVIGGLNVIRTHMATGKLRALATSQATRSPLDPSIPTIAEFIPGVAVGSWIALFAPSGTPRPILDSLGSWVGSALGTADAASKLAVQGLESAASQPKDFRGDILRELERNRTLVDAGVLQRN